MLSSITVTVVGQSLAKHDIRGTSDPGFIAVAERIRAADLAFTNLEAVIRGAHGGWPTKAGYFGAADPIVLDMLRDLGFSALSLSNNHAFDLGPGGVLSTLEEVAKRGFLSAGLGHDATAAATPGYADMPFGRVALVAMDAGPMEEQTTAKDATDRIPSRPGVNPLRIRQIITLPPEPFAALSSIEAGLGHRIRTGDHRRPLPPDGPGELNFYGQHFRLGDTPGKHGEPNTWDRKRNLAAITEAKAASRFVIAYVHHHHWEADWEVVPEWMRGFAHDCVDAGADLVASHGVPILQGIEIYRDRPIFYSLGNFIFHSYDPASWHHDDIWRSVLATCRFARTGKIVQIDLDPIVLGGEGALRNGHFADRLVPVMAQDDGPVILARLARLSAAFGTPLTIENGKGIVRI